MAKDPKASTGNAAKARTGSQTVEDAEVIEEIDADGDSEDEGIRPEDEAASGKATAVGEPDEESSKDATASGAEQGGHAPKPAPRRTRGTGVFLGLVLGGAAAAVIGFGAARYVVPDGWPFPGTQPEEDPLVAVIEAQNDRIGGLSDRLAQLESGAAMAGDLEVFRSWAEALDAELDSRIAALEERLGSFSERLEAMERLAPEGSEAAEAAAAAYERELAALRAMFEGELAALKAQQADVGELEAAAEERAQAAVGRAALARIVTALDTGLPFADALADLAEATGLAPPPALAAAGETGVTTLATLQEAFSPAARAALDVAIRAAVEDGSMSRMSAFLRSQFGARSLEPREGDDPDAVLSRAEAALKRGDIGGALAELAAMPEVSDPALANWKDMATARNAALEAASELARALEAK